jgi:N-acetylglutamate synthase-like GNAT family acetyltransferase
VVTIRPATQADQATIVRLVRQANLNRMNLRWPNFLVAESDGGVVGIGQVKTHRDGSRELASMVVVSERRGQGVGTALIEKLIAEHPNTTLHLTCRRELGGYYERFGFVRLRSSEYTPYFRRLIPIVNFLAGFFGQEILVMRRDS